MISISGILVGLVLAAMIALGAFTFLNNPRERTNSFFGLICIALAAWVEVNYMAGLDLGNSLLWSRLAFMAVTVVLLGFVLFANSFPRSTIKDPLFDWGAVSVGFIITLLCFAPDFIPAITITHGISNVVTGPLYPLFLAYFSVYAVVTIGLLIISFRQSVGSDRERLRYVLTGVILTLIFASTTNLFLPLALGNNDLANYGGFFTLFFIGFTAYAIVRHRLFNVRLLVARSVAYALLISTLAAVYGGLGFAGSQLLFSSSGASTAQTAFNIGLAVMLALTFQPLRALFVRITDRVLYRDHYDSQVVLSQVGSILINEFNLENLLPKTLTALCEALHIQSGQLYVFDDDRIYKIQHYGPLPSKLMTIPHLEQFKHNILVTDELPPGRIQDTLNEYSVRVFMKLRTRQEFVGYLLLSHKLSGDVYSSQDIALLEVLVQELAVAVSNAKAYEDIAKFNLTLQQKIDDATKKLKIANQDLRELDEAKDEFISMASHQLRTPLTSIKGYLSMVLEGDVGRVSSQQKEFLDYAFTGTQRTVNMIADLLNVSRMTAGKFIIERSEVDLTKLVGEEVQQLQQMAESRKLTLKFVPPKKALPIMQLDEGKTRQVVMNFVDNALHYTKEGTVTVSLEQVGKTAELRVKDSGIGVPKEARAHLFSKFYRAGNAQTARPDGTGLGLFLAKRVVEDQGGTIIFESVEGKGSTFGFSMPLTVKESRGTRKQPAGK